MLDSAEDRDSAGSSDPSLAQLFLAFFKMGMFGFGGVLAWSRQVLVDEKRWMTPQEYADVLALCQFLPGGNIMNVSVVVGRRYHGLVGAVVAVVAILVAPAAIVIGLGALYLQYGQTETGNDVLAGITAAAVGFMVAMAAKLGQPLLRSDSWVPAIFAVLTFVAAGVLRLPLPLVLLVLGTASIAFAWRRVS